jgi:hypothetical protein
MNTDNTLNQDQQIQTQAQNEPDLYMEQCFRSIDGPVLEMWERFPISLLRIGRILLTKESERRDFSAAQISRLMAKHGNIMLVSYRPMDIREYFWTHPDVDFVGGGIRVEYFPTSDPHQRNHPPHYSISFYRVYRPEELVVKTPAVHMPPMEGSSELALLGEQTP